MRTTLTLDDDVAAAIETLRREQGLGVSEAVNLLARRGLAAPKRQRRFVPRTAPIGVKVDVTNIAEVLDVLDQMERDPRG